MRNKKIYTEIDIKVVHLGFSAFFNLASIALM